MDERAARHWTESEAFSSPLGPGLTQRRRKIRKGTRSCWACKRRKVRCSYPSEHSQACAHCQRRGSQCIGQDVPEELAPADGSDSEHMTAVEPLAHSLAQRMHNRSGASTSTSSLPTGDSASTPRNVPGVLTPSSTDATLEVCGILVDLVLKPAEGAPLRGSESDLRRELTWGTRIEMRAWRPTDCSGW